MNGRSLGVVGLFAVNVPWCPASAAWPLDGWRPEETTTQTASLRPTSCESRLCTFPSTFCSLELFCDVSLNCGYRKKRFELTTSPRPPALLRLRCWSSLLLLSCWPSSPPPLPDMLLRGHVIIRSLRVGSGQRQEASNRTNRRSF